MFYEYLVIVVLLCLLYFQWCGKYWSRKRVDGPKSVPFVGNMLDYVLAKKHYGEVYAKIYRAYPKAAYVGIYRLLNEPAILVRDLDIVKDVLIKNFNSFHDNFVNVDPKMDPMAIYNPFIAAGEKWKPARSQLGQLFTPTKVKSTFPLIRDICDRFEDYVAKGPDNKFNAFEAKTLCAKYTIEVLASCAFGLEAQTFSNPDSQFSKFSEYLFIPQFWSYFHTVGIHFLSSVAKILRLPYIPKIVQIWLRAIIKEVLNRRKITKEPRNDFLQIIMETKDKNGENLADDVILGHCATMLLEGFDTSSTVMAYCLYQLSINPEIQQRLHEELDSVLTKHNKVLTYEALQEMTYLDAVILETLRMHPAMFASVRTCTQQTELPPQYEGSKGVTIPVGTTVIIPVLAIHYNPEIYDKPNVFDPERFLDENQGNRHKCAYLAFGEGPRICVGMKFGMAQSKAGLATILSKYNVRLSPKTAVPNQVMPTTFLTTSAGGIWINFERRLRKF